MDQLKTFLACRIACAIKCASIRVEVGQHTARLLEYKNGIASAGTDSS